jgi:tetratricopeptide (TPR) repeat protein
LGWDWAGARTDLEKALALDPSDGAVQRRYGFLLASLGRLPEAIAAQRRATELDPLSNAAWENLGRYLIFNRDFAAAHKALSRALEIQPESAFSLYHLGTLQLLEGHAAEALVPEGWGLPDRRRPCVARREGPSVRVAGPCVYAERWRTARH